MVYEPRAGEGANANILTKTIYPRWSVEDATAQPTVTLIAEMDININRKAQRCYTFYVEDDKICSTIKKYVYVTCSEAICFICQYQLADDMPLFDVRISWRKIIFG
jgi:hypothetical protein